MLLSSIYTVQLENIIYFFQYANYNTVVTIMSSSDIKTFVTIMSSGDIKTLQSIAAYTYQALKLRSS